MLSTEPFIHGRSFMGNINPGLNSQVASEQIVRFSEGRKLPTEPSRNCLYNWTMKGYVSKANKERHYLEWCYVGGGKFTSIEAFERFVEKLNQQGEQNGKR